MSGQKVFPRMNKRLTQIEAKKITSHVELGHKIERVKSLIWRERYVTGRNKHLDKTKKEVFNFNSKIWMQNFDNLWPGPHILVFPKKTQNCNYAT